MSCYYFELIAMEWCSCIGDPHCRQLTQSLTDTPIALNWPCGYTLITDQCDPSQTGHASLFIQAKMTESMHNPGHVFVKQLVIQFEGSIIVLQNRTVTVDKQPINVFPYISTPYMIGKSYLGHFFIRMANGIEIYWDGNHGVKFAVPFALKVCGICGHNTKAFTGPDYRAGPGRIAQQCTRHDIPYAIGERTSDLESFARSWGFFVEDDIPCIKDCEGP
ncbi:hypothetical protein CAPTEDRAFT_196964 [Capitella teleta]|uniref:VWFD domain-containing protein n=1 Tax=Capitella teleta TaxID=283909 RepID=R7TIQ7_CAPTE|nr:hypothetical protein CAPTEDRAFT_196964 [Capitella teleta]|eukprot:ELT90975.1 hypothetical protein CAPTEDRAFT_196964 [Capitella teleta]